MEKLRAANLFRNDLIPVSGKLVERYNQCLDILGIVKTNLTNFSIDGIGWSPEISEEKNSIHYLNNGEANPNGIILTPLQKAKPLYAPFHSFDQDLMRHIFKTHEQKINDITRDSAICVDFDQHIDAFYEPLDVLKYKSISIKFRLTNNLDQEQIKQLQWIESFKLGNNFIDEDLHQKLLTSAKTYGDLRHRDLELSELYFTTDSFFTEAFGGVFLLRDFITPIVIFENESWYKEAIKDTAHDVLIFHISHRELSEKLRDHLIIEYDLENVVKTSRYERIKKFLFAQLLIDPQNPIKEILDNKVLFKGYLNKMSIEDRKKIMGVELYLEKMELNNKYKLADSVDKQLFEALQQPHSSLSIKHQDLVWKLLVHLSGLDVLHLFWYDKEQFYKDFKNWENSLQDWVIKTIKDKI